jgi:biotin operon repressor
MTKRNDFNPEKIALTVRKAAPEMLSVIDKAILLDALANPDAHTCQDVGKRLKMNHQTVRKHVRQMNLRGATEQLGLSDYPISIKGIAAPPSKAVPATPFLNAYEQIILWDIKDHATQDENGDYNFRLNDIAQRQGISISAVAKHIGNLRSRGVLVRSDPDERRRKGIGRTYQLAV